MTERSNRVGALLVMLVAMAVGGRAAPLQAKDEGPMVGVSPQTLKFTAIPDMPIEGGWEDLDQFSCSTSFHPSYGAKPGKRSGSSYPPYGSGSSGASSSVLGATPR